MNIFGHATYIGNSGYNSHCKNFFRNLNKYCGLRVRNFTVGPSWDGIHDGLKCHGKDVSKEDKDFICLQTLWSEGKRVDFQVFKKDHATFDYDINLILAEANHYYFYDPYQGPKIAYTVWETTKYFEPFFEKLKEYDQIWVPSKWQADVTIKQGADPQKVKVVPEGVDSSVFFPENYKISGGKFRFLIFGRWDNRKSTVEIIRAFKNTFGNSKNVELIISVEDPYNQDGLGSTRNRLKHYDLESDNISILNFPKKEDYVKFLKSGHVFLSCSRSEGWNLPLIEAMACGTPSIYSDCSGQLEFAQGKGIPIKIKGEIPAKTFYKADQVCQGNWYEPDFKDLEDKIIEVYNNYEYYKQKAVEESKEIREKFTWDNAAKTAMSILSDFALEKKIGNKEEDKAKIAEQITKVRISEPALYEEIFNQNTYENFCRAQVEKEDVVLDLGCSKGFFYFKHKNKNIKYYGVDASSECIKDFYEILNEDDEPIVINAMLDNKKEVRLVKPFFHNTEEKLVSTLSFKNLMKLMPNKVNFLKFDIEGSEKDFIEDEESYQIFKDKIEKFSGEIHMRGGSISRDQAYNIIRKLQNDPDIYCKLYSCDSVDIDFCFWSNPDRFDQIVLSGVVRKNSRHNLFEFKPSLSNERDPLHVVNESPSLGDIIAWMPMLDKLQKENTRSINLYTPHAELFQSVYPNIHFNYYNAQPKQVENVLRLGTYDILGKRWSEFNLQELGAKILGVEYVPTRGKISIPNDKKRKFAKKYVCIAKQSTAQFKYWNNPDGWQRTVDYLKSLDYEVVCIDKSSNFGVEGSMNFIPNNCVDKTGDIPLSDRINDIVHCDFFIGLTSGLSWLAWALHKPVVFISGISLPKTDFPTPYRVTNTNPEICHGCASEPDFIFDKNDWLFCPKKKSFQCTKEISFEMVKEKIDQLIKDHNL